LSTNSRCPPAGSGWTPRITGTSLLTILRSKLVEEAGIPEAVTGLVQLGLIAHPLMAS
jgi:hypothetical protein